MTSVAGIDAPVSFLAFGEHLVVVGLLVLNSVTALSLLLAIREAVRHWHIAEDARLAPILGSAALPPLSVLVAHGDGSVPAFGTLRELLELQYPRHEVILVIDGVPERMARELALYPVPPAVMVSVPTAPVRAYHRSHGFSKLLVIDKERAGRADALNAAINAARYPYVLALDHDTRLVPDALLRLMRPFLLGQLGAVTASTVRVAEGVASTSRAPTGWMAGVQSVETLRDRAWTALGWNALGGIAAPQSAIGLYLRDHALAVGGYRPGAASEDADLMLRLSRHLREQSLPSGVRFLPEAVVTCTQSSSLGAFARRREREQRGSLQLLANNRDLPFRRLGGGSSLLGLSMLVRDAVVAPVLEAAAYLLLLAAVVLGAPLVGYAMLFVLAGPVYTVLLGWWAVALEGINARRPRAASELARLALWALVEPLGYRQLVLWSRLRGAWRARRSDDLTRERRDELVAGPPTPARVAPPA